MTAPPATSPLGDETDVGVYYDDRDYAGLFRRLTIDFVDATVAVLLSVALTAVSYQLFESGTEVVTLAVFLSWVVVWWLYFTVLKRSKLRTIGYAIGGVRIVNLRGERPTLVWLTLRLGFAVLGPFNFLIDLIWIGSDDRKQALRDKFADVCHSP